MLIALLGVNFVLIMSFIVLFLKNGNQDLKDK